MLVMSKYLIQGSDRPKKMLFYGASVIGRLSAYMSPLRNILTRMWPSNRSSYVWCFPIRSLLLAINRTHVDYFSLDVEGAEMSILRKLPFDKIDIDVLQVYIENLYINYNVF